MTTSGKSKPVYTVVRIYENPFKYKVMYYSSTFTVTMTLLGAKVEIRRHKKAMLPNKVVYETN